jgi:hypothetical protein
MLHPTIDTSNDRLKVFFIATHVRTDKCQEVWRRDCEQQINVIEASV